MVRAYEGGSSCQRIAKAHGVSDKVVRRHLLAAGVYETGRRFSGRYSEAQKQEMADLYLGGAGLGEIGGIYGCHRLNVRSILQTRGVPLRSYRTYPLDAESAAFIRKRREAGLAFSDIARELDVPAHRVLKWAREMGISDLLIKRGPDSPSWRGGTTIQHGYRHVQLPADDPLACMSASNEYLPEHRVVMARSLGRPLTRDETVHHINGDRLDNRLENLQLRTGNHGKGARFICADCGSHNVEPAPL